MDTSDFTWDTLGIDEGGLPIHLPIGLTADNNGPTLDSEAHHWGCWCGTNCLLNKALTLASLPKEA